MYSCIHISIYPCNHIHVSDYDMRIVLYLPIDEFMYVCMCVFHVHVHVHVHLHVYVYVHIYVYVYGYVYIHIYTHMYICKNTCIHAHVYRTLCRGFGLRAVSCSLPAAAREGCRAASCCQRPRALRGVFSDGAGLPTYLHFGDSS